MNAGDQNLMLGEWAETVPSELMSSPVAHGSRLVIFLHRPDGAFFTDWDLSLIHI